LYGDGTRDQHGEDAEVVDDVGSGPGADADCNREEPDKDSEGREPLTGDRRPPRPRWAEPCEGQSRREGDGDHGFGDAGLEVVVTLQEGTEVNRCRHHEGRGLDEQEQTNG